MLYFQQQLWLKSLQGEIYFPYVLAHAGLWMYDWTCIFHSRSTKTLVTWATIRVHRPQGSQGPHICTSSETWKSLLTGRYPLIIVEDMLLMAPSSTVSLTLKVVLRLPYLPPKKPTPDIKEETPHFHLPSPLMAKPLLCISSLWVSIQNRRESLNFSGQFLTPLSALSPFEPHCGTESTFEQVSAFIPFH